MGRDGNVITLGQDGEAGSNGNVGQNGAETQMDDTWKQRWKERNGITETSGHLDMKEHQEIMEGDLEKNGLVEVLYGGVVKLD